MLEWCQWLDMRLQVLRLTNLTDTGHKALMPGVTSPLDGGACGARKPHRVGGSRCCLYDAASLAFAIAIAPS